MRNKGQGQVCTDWAQPHERLSPADGLSGGCSQAHLDSKHICLACRVLLLVPTGLHMNRGGQALSTFLTPRCTQIQAMAEANQNGRGSMAPLHTLARGHHMLKEEAAIHTGP